MQFDSIAALTRLETIHKAKSAAARDAQRRRNELAAAATAARRAADEAEAEVKGETAGIRERMAAAAASVADEADKSAKSAIYTEQLFAKERVAKAAHLRARSDELDAALAQADQQAAATRDAATDGGRLYAACADFARAEKLPFPASTKLPGADPLAGVQAQGAFR